MPRKVENVSDQNIFARVDLSVFFEVDVQINPLSYSVVGFFEGLGGYVAWGKS